ncbi:MAG: MFS transporter [Dehalococcoidia bacterium]|nr:MFS transporter [Dehalococcoidia bacterium]
MTTVAMIGLGLLIIVFPFYSEELTGNTNATGLMWASFAIGSTAGAVLTAGLQQRIGPDLMVAGGMALMGFSVLLWPFAPNLWVALPLVGLTGLGDGPSLAALFSVRQRDTPPPLLAQVFTTASSLKLAAFAVGSALAAPIIESWGVEGAVVVAAAMHLAPTAAWLVFWPREEGPAQAEA